MLGELGRKKENMALLSGQTPKISASLPALLCTHGFDNHSAGELP
jgi:hypothetical protein